MGHHKNSNNMLGGSLNRYHTPTMHGGGFMQELVKLAGPSLVRLDMDYKLMKKELLRRTP